jgi:lipopolysaccharide/colanic/teichoic acid biosynthesis glycosyltransferase
MMNRPRLLNAVQSLADNVYRYPAKLRVITEGFRENLVARGVDPSKIEVIPSWVDTELYRPEPRDAALAESLGLADTFNIVFAGAIGLAQNLSTAIDAAAELRDCPDVRMVFIGDGADLQNLKDQAENLQLTNVVFLGRRDVTEMRSLYGLADALMLHLLDEPLFEITIPYKIYAYFASGKPILNAVGGEASRLIQSRGAGISCRSGDPAAMADAVRSLRNMSPEERAALGSAGRQAAVEFYSRPNVTSRVAALVNNAIDEHERLRPTLYDRLKRAIDICVSLIGLVFLSPLLIILAILVRLKLGSPVLFCQKRPGRCGHLFRILKFRTMTDERDENGALLDDSVRLTGFGKFLRSSSFDELPELVNVLRGEMSLVGPRPLLPEYLPLYNDRQNKRHDVRPGITGWAQVNGRNNLNWSDRLELDAWYVENRSLLLDIKIIIKTISQVISRKDVSAEGHATMPRFTGNPSLKDNQ